MSDIRRTVEQLLASSEFRSRLFAVELMGKNVNVFDAVDLTERLRLASLDAHPEVARKAKLTMSYLLKEGFEEQKRIREMGIHSRLMDLSEADRELEAAARARASEILAPAMRKVSELAAPPFSAHTAEALRVVGLSCDLDLAGVLIHATEDGQRRAAAFEALKYFKISELGDLVSSLIDGAREPAELAALAGVLGESGVPAAIPVLADLMKHAHETVRVAAATALGQHSSEGAESALIAHLTDAVPAVQVAVTQALAKISRGATVDALLPLMPRITNPAMQAPALRALGHAKSSRGLPTVLIGLSSPVNQVRVAAVQALGLLKLTPEQVKNHLSPLAADPDLDVRLAAIKALYPHDLERASGALRALLTSQKPPERAAAMSIVGDLQDPQAMEDYLVAMNTEQDRTVVASGLSALDKIADPRLTKAVRRLMAHPNAAVQLPAIRAFGRISGPAGLKELDRLYDESRTKDVKSTILATLGALCDASNISYLTKRLKEQDPDLVTAAIEGLDRVGSLENAMLLETLLAHSSPRVRAAVAVALFHTGDFKVVHVLEEMLARNDTGYIAAALGGLARIHQSLSWAELQKRPLLQTPLMQKPAVEKSATASREIPQERLKLDESRPLPRTTQKLALDKTTPEERTLVRAVQALADSAVPQAREMVNKVLETQPQSELAHLLLQRLLAGTPEVKPLPPELLAGSSFLPLLGEETRMAKQARDTKRLLDSYFRIFERQLDVMKQVITEGRDYLAKGADAQAMEVAKFIVSQMQWTVDFDVRLGLISYDKHEWDKAFTHLLRAFLAAGGDPTIGVHLAAVSMKVKKRELAKTILKHILDSEATDPRVRERAVHVAQAIAQLETSSTSALQPPL